MLNLEFNDPMVLKFERVPAKPQPAKQDFEKGNWLPKGVEPAPLFLAPEPEAFAKLMKEIADDIHKVCGIPNRWVIGVDAASGPDATVYGNLVTGEYVIESGAGESLLGPRKPKTLGECLAKYSAPQDLRDSLKAGDLLMGWCPVTKQYHLVKFCGKGSAAGTVTGIFAANPGSAVYNFKDWYVADAQDRAAFYDETEGITAASREAAVPQVGDLVHFTCCEDAGDDPKQWGGARLYFGYDASPAWREHPHMSGPHEHYTFVRLAVQGTQPGESLLTEAALSNG